MDISYNSIISSSTFNFLVGIDKKLFTVHAGLVAHLSKPFDVLVNGPMSEAKEGCAWLEDVDEHTFVRFSQFAYTGDYIPADPDILLDFNSIANTDSALGDLAHKLDDSEPYVDAEGIAYTRPELQLEQNSSECFESDILPQECGSCNRGKKRGKTKRSGYSLRNGPIEEACASCFESKEAMSSQSKKSRLWAKFKSKVHITPPPDFQPRKNRESCEDYTEVFLCHARLYVFAETYDIDRLKELSLHKLQQTLVEFTLYSQRVADIIDLMQYTYLNTAERSESIDSLRLLVIHYAACVVENLAQSPQFQQLVEDMGPLARDLMGQILQRLD